jgi:hypothetical protein
MKSRLSLLLGLAAMAGSMETDFEGGSGKRRWRYERKKEEPKEPKYSLPKEQPKGTQLFEGEIQGIKVAFYYGSEKSKQKKLIKITHEINYYLRVKEICTQLK